MIPCALVTAGVMLVLGPPLGDLLAGDPSDFRYLPRYAPFADPEPTEKGRFLLALAGPLLLSLATVLVVRRHPRSTKLPALAIGAQGVVIAFVIACLVGQYAATYGPIVSRMPDTWVHWTFFTPATLVIAALAAMAVVLAVRTDGARSAVAGWLGESPRRRIAATAAAAVMTGVWLLHAVDSDASIANAAWDVRFHVEFTSDEAFAVLNGLTPLVDFSAQYGSLWPYLAALSMAVFGKTLLVFTLTMCAVSAVALLAVYGVLRRVTGSAIAALALYLPFLATSMFLVRGTLSERETFGNYFGVLPLRYAGPYLLAWLTARHIDRGGRGSALLLFSVAGLVALNNLDFGLAALGASVAALAWTTVPPRRAALARLAAAVVAGLALAFALVSLLTLARAGELPRIERMTDYVRMFAVGGFGMGPIANVLGLHLILYITYAGAIGTATVRALGGAPNRILTGMLAWSGVFGLGAGSYFAGRSNPEALIACFSAWALALALLAVVAVGALAARPRHLPSPANVAILLGLGLAFCSLAQTPLPWTQLSRLNAPFTAEEASRVAEPHVPPTDSGSRAFITAAPGGARPGAPIAILTTTGHRLAEAYGVRNVAAYTGIESMLTEERIDATLDALRRAGGTTVIVPAGADERVFELLAQHGFQVLSRANRPMPYAPERGIRAAGWREWTDDALTKWVAAQP